VKLTYHRGGVCELVELWIGFGILILYFLICATGAMILRRIVTIPKEIFRKTLHTILLGSIFIFAYAFHSWWISAIASIAFVMVVYPVLSIAERFKGYSELLTERKCGEIKRSLVVVFVMFSTLIVVCWGVLDQKYLVIAAVMAWGLGDAAAALVGKKYGRHIFEGKQIEGKKSLEGTLAMFAVSFASVLLVLILISPIQWKYFIPLSIVTAAVSAMAELFTKDGMDTITCPFSAAFAMIVLLQIGGLLL